ncbi:MAG: HIT domain-containing protein [Firmicutes bacterium]|nr:HIT domain-containing protein [Bacillota bacterium]
MDCIFCKIINGDIPSYTIYEDDIVKVFLDIEPNTNGHMLIIPKKHYTNIVDIDIDTMSHIIKIQKEMYELVKEKLGAEGATFAQNNDLGQDVKHYHMHLIPRYQNDGWKNSYDMNNKNSVEEIFNKLKSE